MRPQARFCHACGHDLTIAARPGPPGQAAAVSVQAPPAAAGRRRGAATYARLLAALVAFALSLAVFLNLAPYFQRLLQGASTSTDFTVPVYVTNPNWAGYAWPHPAITDISARWVVPTLTCGAAGQEMSIWVGAGSQGSDVLQDGSDTQCTPSGQRTTLWWEWYPKLGNAQKAGDASAGDTILARVWQVGPKSWLWSLKDETSGSLYQASGPIGYDVPVGYAEWIVEDPAISVNPITYTPFPASFSPISFHDMTAAPGPWQVKTINLCVLRIDGIVRARPTKLSNAPGSGGTMTVEYVPGNVKFQG